MRLLLLSSLAGCVSGVLDLDPGPSPNSGLRDSGMALEDAGAEADAGTEVPWDCPSEWTTIVTTAASYGLASGSLAALPGGFAVTWSEFDEQWVETSYLQFLDREAQPAGAPLLVASGSRVVAVGDRFFRGGFDGGEWFEVDGTPVGTLEIGPFIPSVVYGERIYGRVPRDASDPAPAVLNAVDASLQVMPVDVGFGAAVVFGPDRFVVVEHAMSGATVKLFLIDGDEAVLVVEHVLLAEEIEGEIWVPTDLAAGAWNASLDRFELLFAVNVANGRFYGAEIFTLSGPELGEGAPLPDQLSPITHATLEAALAVGDRGSFVVAYHDNFTSLSSQLVLVIDGTVQQFELGARTRSGPMLAAVREGFAIVSPRLTPEAQFWENELRLRCLR